MAAAVQHKLKKASCQATMSPIKYAIAIGDTKIIIVYAAVYLAAYIVTIVICNFICSYLSIQYSQLVEHQLSNLHTLGSNLPKTVQIRKSYNTIML